MKPNFALSLSFEGIRLLHRAAGGWRQVGEVGLDTADLGGALAVLRRTASGLEAGGVQTKLLIPNDQIKYLTVETPGLSHAARLKAAEKALDGATPYDVADLAYDICEDGAQTHVAAVARDTLREAETFAAEHKFAPLAFVAVPGEAPFLGEPFFGPTEFSQTYLEPGDTVEADGIAVVVLGTVAAPDGPVVADAEAPSDEEDQNGTVIAPEVEDIEVTADPEPDDEAQAETEEQPEEPGDAPTEAADGPEDDSAVTPDSTSPEAVASTAAEPAGDTGAAVASAEAVEDSVELTTSEPDDSAAAQVTALDDDSTSEAEPSSDGQPDTDQPDEPAPERPPEQDAAPIAFASKRADPQPETQAEAEPVAAAEAAFSSRRGPSERPDGRREPVLRAAAAPVTSPTLDIPETESGPTAPLVAAPVTAAAASSPEPKAGFFSRRRARIAAALTPEPKVEPAVAASARVLPAPSAIAPSRHATEQQRMTVFGARKDDVGGKPRFLGLILTAFLLVFLAGVAAWASVFLDDGLASWFGRSEPRQTASASASLPAPRVLLPETAEDAFEEPEALPVVTAALDPALTEEDGAVLDALRAPVLPEIPEMTDAELAANYAVTGIWPRSPDMPKAPDSVSFSEIYLNTLDPVTISNDAIALETIARLQTDEPVAALAPPPRPGQRFVLGPNGLVIPSPEGTLSPGGILIFKGRPEIVPPVTRARVEVEEPPAVSEALEALAQARPKTRPAGLAEKAERAQLGGATRSELAGKRPRLRPKSLNEKALALAAARKAEEDARKVAEEAAEAAKKEAEAEAADAAAKAAAASLARTEPEAEAEAEAPRPQGTKLAARNSLRPDARPRNFGRVVQRAQRNAANRTARSNNSGADNDRGRETRSVAARTVKPKVATSRTVARNATVKNAINLRKVNLIGVYGKPSKRRALVRLANGRYKKVVVGDRIDGGRVSAIGNSELRYRKGGRNVVLKMPRG